MAQPMHLIKGSLRKLFHVYRPLTLRNLVGEIFASWCTDKGTEAQRSDLTHLGFQQGSLGNWFIVVTHYLQRQQLTRLPYNPQEVD